MCSLTYIAICSETEVLSCSIIINSSKSSNPPESSPVHGPEFIDMAFEFSAPILSPESTPECSPELNREPTHGTELNRVPSSPSSLLVPSSPPWSPESPESPLVLSSSPSSPLVPSSSPSSASSTPPVPAPPERLPESNLARRQVISPNIFFFLGGSICPHRGRARQPGQGHEGPSSMAS